MQNKSNEFLWGDEWCVEDNRAWFVSVKKNILFSVDMSKDQYKIVATLPDYFQDKSRRNSNCIKCDNFVFCMPDEGDCIWCYDLYTADFQKITIENPNNVRMMIIDFWKCEDTLWAVSMGLKQIIEIDVKKKKVLNYYNITDQENDTVAKSVKWGKYIYSASASKGKIYIFNIETKAIKVKEFSGIKNGLRTISVDRGKIWLSGYKKELYVYNEDKNKINVLENLPSDFGIYNFDGKEQLLFDCEKTEYDTATFLKSINIGNYIWFIPFQTNQILYVDKNTNEINVFEIEDEEEDEKTIKSREMNCKYVLQYVYEDRYIGLYSFKNEVVFEIDGKTLKMKRRFLTIDTDDLDKNFIGWNFQESVGAERKLYGTLLKRDVENVFRKERVGEKIYTHVK